ncbi:MAG: PQQ-dependent sugar dehydrogenase [Novosphingobium sp.]
MAQRNFLITAILGTCVALASCGANPAGESHASSRPTDTTIKAAEAFEIETATRLDEPWAMAFAPGTPVLFITRKAGAIVGYDTATGREYSVSGAPTVAYGGQGGLGDIAFLASEAAKDISGRTVYLSWAEPGSGNKRGAAVGRGTLSCTSGGDCAIRDLTVIWRQQPKVTGRGHFSHRIAISPDGQYLFIASGDRQKMAPAQDTSNTLGMIVRLNLDGSTARSNPFSGRGSPTDEIWSFGHRNILGLAFAPDGRLWEIEHGPRGGDELNLVEPGNNYGWPLVSNGVHYSGEAIPDHATRPDLAAPAISWSPVIAPGDMLFVTSPLFPAWHGQAVITGLASEALVRVSIRGETAREEARYAFGSRLRAVAQAPDGALWLAEDGKDARLMRLTPRAPALPATSTATQK